MGSASHVNACVDMYVRSKSLWGHQAIKSAKESILTAVIAMFFLYESSCLRSSLLSSLTYRSSVYEVNHTEPISTPLIDVRFTLCMYIDKFQDGQIANEAHEEHCLRLHIFNCNDYPLAPNKGTVVTSRWPHHLSSSA